MFTKKYFYLFLLCSFFIACSPSSQDKGTATEATDLPDDMEISPHSLAEEAKIKSVKALLAELEASDEASESNREITSAPKGDKGFAKPKPKKKTTWKRSKVVPHSSKLTTGYEETLPLKGTQMMVQVDGFRARVVVDYYYFNDKGRQLEGTFKLRLPNDASPYFFAFGQTTYKKNDIPSFVEVSNNKDIKLHPKELMQLRNDSWTQPKEAKIVPKEKAAFAYKQTVRQRVDPALVEWAGADVFSANVFPLAPNQLHRITFAYDVNLSDLDGDKELRLPLPEGDTPFVIDVDAAVLGKITPIISKGYAAKNTKKGRVKAHFNNTDAKEITIQYKNASTILLSGKEYFGASFTPKLPSANAVKNSKYATFVVDASLSSAPDKFNVWLDMMEAILNNNRDVIEHFSVVFFNVETHWWKPDWVANTPANVKAIMAYANTLSLEGATDIGTALGATNTNVLNRRDLFFKNIFLLSDASISWGENDFNALAAKINKNDRLYAYKTGFAGTDNRLMEHLTRNTGGAVFSVVGESQIEKASKAFRTAPWRIEQLSMAGGTDLILEGRPQFLYNGQPLVLAGRGKPSKGAKLKMTLSQGNDSKTITVPFNTKITSNLANRTYGQIATNQLEEFGLFTEKYSKSYATHFRVPGKTCSLLMLETEEDYANFDIKPEDDAFVVENKPVNGIVTKVVREMGDVLSDAKVAFNNWFKKLQSTSGVTFSVPTSLEVLLESTPKESFEINPKQLVIKTRTKKNVSTSFQKELGKNELIYKTIAAEAERRKGKYGVDDALKTMSSLVEKSPGDGVLARDIGFSAMEWGLEEQAYYLFKRTIIARPFEPQSYHAIAQVLTKMGKTDLAMLYYEIALAGAWDTRFGEFKTIASLDYMHLLQEIGASKHKAHSPKYAASRLATLRKEHKVDDAKLMITIMWNTDNTDIDLHVVEPSGEECYYQHKDTKSGGHLTQDVTQGYGPEMYLHKTAKRGKYKVKANYYSTNPNRSSAPTKIYATVYENWGKKGEKITRKVVTLGESKEMRAIMDVKLR